MTEAQQEENTSQISETPRWVCATAKHRGRRVDFSAALLGVSSIANAGPLGKRPGGVGSLHVSA